MHQMTRSEKKLIFASSLGTIFEWYDFYLFGYLAIIFSKLYFTQLDPNSAFILSLCAFASGFLFRPIGAIIFGHLGDILGRKFTFLFTIFMMGLATCMVGLLPTYQQVGIWAPISLVLLRILQGIALGGEYGGAAIYIAEFAPAHRRAEYTSWIQIAPSIGYFISISSIVTLQAILGLSAFEQWGWRICFLMSSIYLIFSIFLRMKMQESKAFQNLKLNGGLSRSPIRETFLVWDNLKKVLICLFGGILGQAIIISMSNLYLLYFLTQILKVESFAANLCLSISLIFYIIFILFFGRIADIWGRRKLIVMGCFLGCISIYPVYQALTWAANPLLAKAQINTPIILRAPAKTCHFQFLELSEPNTPLTACDQAKKALIERGLGYRQINIADGQPVLIEFGKDKIALQNDSSISSELQTLQKKYHYPERANMQEFNYFKVIGLISYLLFISAMLLGPLACFLVEMFPTRIRYTGMSFPYHFANGFFGGFLPAISFAIVTYTGNLYSGLYYGMILSGLAFVVSLLFVPETKETNIH
jgi:MFS family permease